MARHCAERPPMSAGLCVLCGRPLRRINYRAMGGGRVSCEHYACLSWDCWSASDGQHLIPTDCEAHRPRSDLTLW